MSDSNPNAQGCPEDEPTDPAGNLDDRTHSDHDRHEDPETPTKPDEELDPTLRVAAREDRLRTARTIGNYKLLGIIGEGGFGVVWEAEQTEPVHRRVAVKIIKPGMDSKAVVARFEAERQVLAVMDHPGIARVFDGGVTSDGYPYFVMELIKGEPVTEFCDRHCFSIERRLELMIEIAEAVQHAHSKGVIHRDIKPINILVGYDSSGSARSKVIDFGVAKALDQRLTERTIFTERGQLIGTPEYMSPEQAEMTGADIDTRADVYSLGVLLYEILTGMTPFDSATLRRASFEEIQRIIRDQDPDRPSTRLSTLDSVSDDSEIWPRITRARATDGRTLTAALRRDLDWVVMRCLEKDRERRYDTANALAAELRRYLDGKPVLSGPPTATYRLQKYVRKNGHALSVGSVMVALAGGLLVSLWLLSQRINSQSNRQPLTGQEDSTPGEGVPGGLAPNEGGLTQAEVEALLTHGSPKGYDIEFTVGNDVANNTQVQVYLKAYAEREYAHLASTGGFQGASLRRQIIEGTNNSEWSFNSPEEGRNKLLSRDDDTWIEWNLSANWIVVMARIGVDSYHALPLPLAQANWDSQRIEIEINSNGVDLKTRNRASGRPEGSTYMITFKISDDVGQSTQVQVFLKGYSDSEYYSMAPSGEFQGEKLRDLIHEGRRNAEWAFLSPAEGRSKLLSSRAAQWDDWQRSANWIVVMARVGAETYSSLPLPLAPDKWDGQEIAIEIGPDGIDLLTRMHID